MTWEISMSAEGWSNVYDNLHAMDKADLVEAMATNKFDEACAKDEEEDFDWEAVKADLGQLSNECLADECYRYVELHDSCDNGGWNAYIDKGGYCTVSCSSADEDSQ